MLTPGDSTTLLCTLHPFPPPADRKGSRDQHGWEWAGWGKVCTEETKQEPTAGANTWVRVNYGQPELAMTSCQSLPWIGSNTRSSRTARHLLHSLSQHLVTTNTSSAGQPAAAVRDDRNMMSQRGVSSSCDGVQTYNTSQEVVQFDDDAKAEAEEWAKSSRAGCEDNTTKTEPTNTASAEPPGAELRDEANNMPERRVARDGIAYTYEQLICCLLWWSRERGGTLERSFSCCTAKRPRLAVARRLAVVFQDG